MAFPPSTFPAEMPVTVEKVELEVAAEQGHGYAPVETAVLADPDPTAETGAMPEHSPSRPNGFPNCDPCWVTGLLSGIMGEIQAQEAKAAVVGTQV